MSSGLKYIIVDDDLFNNRICSIVIKNVLGECDLQIFSSPEMALTFIQREYSNKLKPTILFLDINMPTLTGWEFLEQYQKFSDDIKTQITIYILSSSMDQPDRDKAMSNPNIKRFITKPLTREIICSITEEMHSWIALN